MTAQEINNVVDILDSRDIIARVEELSAERRDFLDAIADSNTTEEARAQVAADLAQWDSDYAEELACLQALAEESELYSEDWADGATLIRDSYFVDYAQELADDISATKDDAQWPLNCIDWQKAARELRVDYTAVSFDGVTYWVR